MRDGNAMSNYFTAVEVFRGSNNLLFCDHFEELQTVFIEVKLINSAPLTYLYPNTIKTYLTPNLLLFGRQLLCYSNINYY